MNMLIAHIPSSGRRAFVVALVALPYARAAQAFIPFSGAGHEQAVRPQGTLMRSEEA